jgi:outer membrane murein-binding lipoprotein Lpp
MTTNAWFHVVGLISAGLLGLGFVAGLVSVGLSWKANGELQTDLRRMDAQNLALEKELTQEKKEIASVNAQAAEANRRAAEAQLALEKFKAPRTLTPEQRGRIVDKLKQFSGTEYDITVSSADPEILDFVFKVELVLSTAGWIELDWKGTGEGLRRTQGQKIIREGVSVIDVKIGVMVDQPLKLFEFAQALSDALEAEGVTAAAERHIRHEMSSTNANAIHILIGRQQ